MSEDITRDQNLLRVQYSGCFLSEVYFVRNPITRAIHNEPPSSPVKPLISEVGYSYLTRSLLRQKSKRNFDGHAYLERLAVAPNGWGQVPRLHRLDRSPGQTFLYAADGPRVLHFPILIYSDQDPD